VPPDPIPSSIAEESPGPSFPASPPPKSRRRLVALAIIGGLAVIAGFAVFGPSQIRSQGEEFVMVHPAIVDRPGTDVTPNETDARAALAQAEQADARSIATAESRAKLFVALGEAGRINEALEVHAQLWAMHRAVGTGDLRRVDAVGALAGQLGKEHWPAAVSALWAHAYEQRRSILGRRHEFTLDALRHLSWSYREAGAELALLPVLLELNDEANPIGKSFSHPSVG
jgi:hypothetical protein